MDKPVIYYDTIGPHSRGLYEEKYGRNFPCMYPECPRLVTKVWFRVEKETVPGDEFDYSYVCIGWSCDIETHFPAHDNPMVG